MMENINDECLILVARAMVVSFGIGMFVAAGVIITIKGWKTIK